MLKPGGGPYCWIRVARLATWADAGQMGRHGRREGLAEEYAHCAPELRHRLAYGTDIPDADPRDPAMCMRRGAELKGAACRKGASVGAHVICFASPSYFRPDDPAAVGTWRPDRLEAFTTSALAAVRARYGPIAAWRVDVDEGTPHLDVFLVPASRRRTRGGRAKLEVSFRDAFGGAKHRLRELQDWFSAAMAPLGLKRGKPVEATGAKHVPPRVLHRRLARDADEARATRAVAEADAAQAVEQLEEARGKAGLNERERLRLDDLARALEARGTVLDGRENALRRLEQQIEQRREAGELSTAEARTAALAELRAAAEQRRAAQEDRKLAESERASAARDAAALRGVLLKARGAAVEQAMSAVEPALAVTALMRERLQDLASGVPRVPRAVRPSAVALVTAVGDFIGWSDEALDAVLAKLGGATGARDRRAFETVFSRAVRNRQTAWIQPLKRRQAFPAAVHEVRRAAASLDDSIRISAETPDAGPGIRPAFLAETSTATETPRRTLRRPGAER